MNTLQRLLRRLPRDRGSALVAAMGVALIGSAFCTIVVAVAIGVTNDSARDRVRTIEVHAAESVLDTTLNALETTAPCTVADSVIGSGTTAVTVHTTIEYSNASGLLTACSAGKIVGTPTKATVSSTGTAAAVTASGIPPQRTIQAQVNIKPVVAVSAGSAVFGGTSISVGGGVTVSAADATKRARVWLDSGNFSCVNTTINGDVVVAQGSLTLSNASCTIAYDAWAKTGFAATSTPSAPYSIGGNLTVYGGTGINLQNDNRFGGSVSVGDTGSNPPVGSSYFWPRATVVGPVCYGTGAQKCATLTNFAPMGFPAINYVPGDFTSLGFSGTPLPAGPSTVSSFESAIIKSWGFTPAAWQLSSQDSNPCSPVQSISTNAIRLPEGTSTSKTMYDCTKWGWGAGNGGGRVTLTLYADIVIYANSFQEGNGLTVQSGDGLQHFLYMIVPKTVAGLSGYTPGQIKFDTGVQVKSPAAIFLYTPGNLEFPNQSEVYGQFYGGTVTIGQSGGTIKYLSVPLPNGYLSGATSAPAGYKVEVIDKSEQ